MKIVFLCKGATDSGNYVTCSRIKNNLMLNHLSSKDECHLICLENFEDSQEIILEADVLFCLHLYRCHSVLNIIEKSKRQITIVGIVGGTDINVDIFDNKKYSDMKEFVTKCRFIVTFTEDVQPTLQNYFNLTMDQIHIIQQGVDVEQIAPSYLTVRLLEPVIQAISCSSSCIETALYFICIGRIRPVKNLHSIIQPFLEWSLEHNNNQFHLLFVGGIEDSEYSEMFTKQCGNQRNIHVISRSLSRDCTLHLLRNSLLLINSSLSEGQCNSILEAMALSVPILASNCPGNSNLIKHNKNGLLYNTKQEFKECLTKISSADIQDKKHVRQMTENAKTHIENFHSPSKEAEKYYNLIKNLHTNTL